ncbi:zf-HC2 domain-containing protein [Ruminococcus sp.]|uniref:zf-HC2 domain-containing protein n=1 Tax=Ruminococcus sp. TaxID=41978 RepID=UPI0025E4B059|nr:zf-HC2 domain-containing protein [Ruminococcus sp.]
MKNCDIVMDLLPLYADDVCSEESRKEVEEHIKGCTSCKSTLEKLRKNVSISPQKDAEVLKRIKKRLRIEKLVVVLISATVLVFVLLGTLFYLINSDCSMDIERYDIPNNVYVSEVDGMLMLCVKGGASSFDSVYPTFSDTNGNHLTYDKDYDKNSKNGIGYTLKQRKISRFSYVDMGNLYSFAYQVGTVEKLKEKNIEKIFYYDDVNNKEFILWESDKND